MFAIEPKAVLASLLLLALPPLRELRAQDAPAGYRIEVELASLYVVPDTLTGLSLLMQPRAGSRGKEREGPVWLRLQPDSALEWINSAVAAIRTPLPGDQSEGIQWSRTLRPHRDSGAVALGRSRKKGKLVRTHWLAIADSASGWRFELTAGEADSLLRLLLIGGSQSRTDTSAAAPFRKLISLPLYKLEPTTPNGLFSEQIIGYSNGGIQLNYAHYLTLSPRFSSGLRLRSGQDYARGAGGARGIFLDWENEYRVGSTGEGEIALTGIGRPDMGLSWAHSQRFDPVTYFSASVDMPAFKGLYGNVNASRDFGFVNASVSGSSAKSFSGLDFESHRVDANLETDMKRIPGIAVTHSYGLTATTAESLLEGTRTSQEGVGVRGRWVLVPQPLWQGGTLNANVAVTQLWGRAEDNLSTIARVGVDSRLWRGANASIAYNLFEDKLNAPLIGRHRLDGTFFWETDKYRLNLFGAKALDIDSSTFFIDASYRLSKIWRIGASYSADRFNKNFVEDQTLILAYRIGIREFAITYSIDEDRFGFEIFNVPIR
jgi:hypothetical protein